jgi:hypothetical protein
MTFVPISKKKYIRLHLKSNPDTQTDDLDTRLSGALADYKNGVKCACGNDIWVIGSAQAGNACFTCLTGESRPSADFELVEALPKSR